MKKYKTWTNFSKIGLFWEERHCNVQHKYEIGITFTKSPNNWEITFSFIFFEFTFSVMW